MPTLVPITSWPSTVAFGGRQTREVRERLSSALRDWWDRERADWDAQVEGSGTEAASEAAGSDLWDSMPMIDSKEVARTSSVFEEHLGRPLDVRLIRPGGYDSIKNMIRHLVPAMMDAPQARGGIRAVEQEASS